MGDKPIIPSADERTVHFVECQFKSGRAFLETSTPFTEEMALRAILDGTIEDPVRILAVSLTVPPSVRDVTVRFGEMVFEHFCLHGGFGGVSAGLRNLCELAGFDVDEAASAERAEGQAWRRQLESTRIPA